MTRIRKTIICKDCGRERPHCAKGLCVTCYKHRYPPKKTIICEDCGKEKTHYAFGLCKTCYSRKKYAENKRRGQVGWGQVGRLRRLYNISIDEYDEMLETQGNACWICGKSPEENGRRLDIDHDHTTGEVRGLLCNSCNTGLGKFGDNPQVLFKAIEYLLRT